MTNQAPPKRGSHNPAPCGHIPAPVASGFSRNLMAVLLPPYRFVLFVSFELFVSSS